MQGCPMHTHYLVGRSTYGFFFLEIIMQNPIPHRVMGLAHRFPPVKIHIDPYCGS